MSDNPITDEEIASEKAIRFRERGYVVKFMSSKTLRKAWIEQLADAEMYQDELEYRERHGEPDRIPCNHPCSCHGQLDRGNNPECGCCTDGLPAKDEAND